jgi:TRAP transporter TAXI family solute receptor
MRGSVGLGLAVVLATGALSCSPNDPPGGEGRLSIATGGAGGVYQVYGGALADLMSDELPDTPTTAETTSASVDNLLLVANGDSDIAFALEDSAIDAVRGQESFDEPLPLRAIGMLYPNITQVVVKADSDVQSIEDLRDHTVSVGSPGSGTEVIALRLLEVAGVDAEKDIAKRQLGVGESVQALRDGSIDAFFWSGGVPTGAVTDLATTDEIRLLETDQYRGALLNEYSEAYQRTTVEDDEYAGVEGVATIAVPNVLIVHEDMDDELVYEITKALYEGKDRLATVVPAAEALDPSKGREVIDPIELHAGAERYYAEAGG